MWERIRSRTSSLTRPDAPWRRSAVTQFFLRTWAIYSIRRISGLSAEAGFWLVFSLPWLLLGAVSVVGLFDELLSANTVASLQTAILDAAARVLTPEIMTTYIEPLVTELFSEGSAGLTVVSLLIALYSGSRGIQTFIEANMIINGEFMRRNFVVIRAMSAALLVVGTLLLALSVAVFTAGSSRTGEFLALPGWFVTVVWGALAVGFVLALLVAMMHFSMVQRPSLISSVPGALLMVIGWWAGSLYLSRYLQRLFADTSVYGVLAAPIAIMLYAYVLALVAFLGSSVNAALRGVDPRPPRDEDGKVVTPEPTSSVVSRPASAD